MRTFIYPENEKKYLIEKIEKNRIIYNKFTKENGEISRTIGNETVSIEKNITHNTLIFKLNGKIVNLFHFEIKEMILQGISFDEARKYLAKMSFENDKKRKENQSLLLITDFKLEHKISISYFDEGVVIHFLNNKKQVKRFFYDDFVELVKKEKKLFSKKNQKITISEREYDYDYLKRVIDSFNKQYPDYITGKPSTIKL